MINPKEYLTACGPKKGECYICGKSLADLPSLLVSVQVPIVKVKKEAGRACIECSLELRQLVDLRIVQAQKGEY